jgi:hypothetical protein
MDGTRDPATPASAEQVPATSRGRNPPRAASDEDVLAAVIELSARYRAPSTSLITWWLVRDSRVTGAFQSTVRSALQRLRAQGHVSCVMHRGTQRWSATRRRDPTQT